MGGSHSTVKTTIKNKINIFIEQTNEQYINIVNDTCTSVITNASNKQIAEINTNASAFNSISIKGGIHVSGNGVIDLEQNASITNTAKALLSLVQNNDLLNNISSDSQSQIAQALSNHQDLTSDMKLVSSIQNTTKSDGEMNNFIDKVQGMVDDLLGKDETNETDIENSVKQHLKTTDIENTNISNIISNSFTTNVSTSTLNSCLTKNASGNSITIEDGIWIDGNGKLKDIQDAYVTQVTECVISSMLTTESTNILKNMQTNNASQSETSDQKAKTSVDASSNVVNSKTETSFLDIIMNNITIIIIVIGVLVAMGMIAFGGPIISSIFKKKPQYSAPINHTN